MHHYEDMRAKYSKPVCQTVDSPILVFDYFELGEMFVALITLLIFGIIITSWKLIILSLFTTLGVFPVLRRRNTKGYIIHWPYKHFNMNLPGLTNPKGNKKYSD